jgi:hypothetical protein
MWDGYENFVNSCEDNNVLYVTSGYYPIELDNLLEEIKAISIPEKNAEQIRVRRMTRRPESIKLIV